MATVCRIACIAAAHSHLTCSATRKSCRSLRRAWIWSCYLTSSNSLRIRISCCAKWAACAGARGQRRHYRLQSTPSLWGLRRSFAGNLGDVPWQGQYFSVPRLKDWLTLLSFETHAGAFGCYAPPVSSEAWLRRWSFMDAAGVHWWHFAGGAYILQAVKRVRGMQLIMPDWRARVRPRKAMAPVSRR